MAIVLTLAILAAACAGNETAPSTEPSRIAQPATTTNVIARPTPAVPAPAFPQWGMNAPQWDSTGYLGDGYAESFDALVDTGVDWIVLVPTWYQDDRKDAAIAPEPDGRTPTDDSLRFAIERAHAEGLAVMLKPHVDLTDGGSRTRIEPDDVDAWFESYQRFIVHYARLAADAGVAQLAVGTELRGTTGETDAWRRVIDSVRQVYPGSLTYAANWDEYQDVEFWDDLDLIGVDAYFPLTEEATSDVDLLTEAWQQIAADLAAEASEWNRPVVLTEVGYESRRGTTTAPFDRDVSVTLDFEEPAAATRAMVNVLSDKSWFAGLHWWMWFDYPGEGREEAEALGKSPRDKPVLEVLMQAWAG